MEESKEMEQINSDMKKEESTSDENLNTTDMKKEESTSDENLNTTEMKKEESTIDENQSTTECRTGVLIEFDIDDKASLRGAEGPSMPLHLDELQTISSENLDNETEKDVKKKSTIIDLEEDTNLCSLVEKCCINDYVEDNFPTIKSTKWKTPSPRSMAHINKEASKVIDIIKFTPLLDENTLLNEEILPIPLDFAEFDLEDSSSNTEDELRNKDHTEVLVNNKNILGNSKFKEIYPEFNSSEVTESSCDKLQHSALADNANEISEISIAISKNEEIVDENKIIGSNTSPNKRQTCILISKEKQPPHISYNKQLEIHAKPEKATSEISSELNSNDVIDYPSANPEYFSTIDDVSTVNPAIDENKTEKCLFGLNIPKVKIPKYSMCKASPTSQISYSKKLQMMRDSSMNKEVGAKTQKLGSSMKKSEKSVHSSNKGQSLITRHSSIAQPARYSLSMHSDVQTRLSTPPTMQSLRFPSMSRGIPRSASLSFSKSWQHSSSANKASKIARVPEIARLPMSWSSKKPEPAKIPILPKKHEVHNLNIKEEKTECSKSFITPVKTVKRSESMTSSRRRRFQHKLDMPSPLSAEQDKNLAKELFK